MKRVELLERLNKLQAHELYRGKDIRSISAFMDNKALELHIQNFEKGIDVSTNKGA
ncbi:hypothetical protein [Pseudaminobacter sp. NGMCC 1.201702]|jgi:hypothetical protein|uniref:hypothetical protein n=1 Tax=Pseudaminobacter sp. NGMCC 1.201702 TaxID=3391825 RepID=UPI0039EEFD25